MRDQEDDGDENLFAEMQAARAKLPRPRRRQKAGNDTFVQVPLWWLERVVQVVRSPQQVFVAVWLLHLRWKTKSEGFPVPNRLLAKHGINRQSKHLALTKLAAAGLIVVEKSNRKTPRVTLVL
jgi:hypothetical protein